MAWVSGGQPDDKQAGKSEFERKHPVWYYWATAGLAAVICAGIAVPLTSSSHSTSTNSGGGSANQAPYGGGLSTRPTEENPGLGGSGVPSDATTSVGSTGAEAAQIPFTAGALLPTNFTDSKNIVFGLEASGIEPCDQAAGGGVLQELLSNNCAQMLYGVYLEQACAACTPNNPVWISVEIFPFGDDQTARQEGQYLWADYHWTELAKWCTQSGPGNAPCSSNAGYQEMNYSVHSGYLTVATTERTDLTDDTSIVPWLDAAIGQALDDCGPQNYDAS